MSWKRSLHDFHLLFLVVLYFKSVNHRFLGLIISLNCVIAIKNVFFSKSRCFISYVRSKSTAFESFLGELMSKPTANACCKEPSAERPFFKRKRISHLHWSGCKKSITVWKFLKTLSFLWSWLELLCYAFTYCFMRHPDQDQRLIITYW